MVARRTRFLNRLRIVLDRQLTVANAIDIAVASHPDSAVFHLDQELPYRLLAGREITPRRLCAFVDRLGHVLREHGLQRGGRVAIFKTNGPDYFFLALAVIRAGGIAVPMNSGMERGPLSRYLAHCQAAMIVTDAWTFRARQLDPADFPTVRVWLFAGPAPSIDATVVELDPALERASEAPQVTDLAPHDEVLLVHTSGTTGVPKGVVCTSGSLVRGIKGHYAGEPLPTSTRTAVAGHFNHLVYQVGLFSSLLANLPVWTLSRHEPKHVLDTLERERIHIFFAFPDIYLRMLEMGLDGHDLGSMRIWMATADTSHEPHMEVFCRKGALLRLFGKPVVRSLFIEGLGSSEIGFAALMRIFFPFGRPRLRRMVGWRAIAGPRVRIVDDEWRTLPAGRIGRLAVKGPTLFKGYWNAPEMLEHVTRDGWWWTGDIAYRDRLGRFYHLDRATDVIATAEGPVYTLPAEEMLHAYPGVSEAVVFGVPADDRTAVPVAVINQLPGAVVDVQACREWVNLRLRLPIGLRDIVAVEPGDIPRGLTGKVLKRVMRDSYSVWRAAGGGDSSRAPARSSGNGR
jgi:acyl-coenzyme A synthetase/AMP-(fatty) acid ligase